GWRTREDARAGARLELGDELGPAPHESNQSRQRHELPERNEANLIIPADDPAFREEKRAVTKLRRSLSLNVDRADQNGRVDRRERTRQPASAALAATITSETA